jgi:broad specificity phosphatase PhoE
LGESSRDHHHHKNDHPTQKSTTATPINDASAVPSANNMTRTAIERKSGGFLPDSFAYTNPKLGKQESMYGQLVAFDDDDEDEESSEAPPCLPAGKVVAEDDHDENNSNSSNQDRDDQEILLYLIRHGEAEHNIEEKKAMEEAKRMAVEEEGLAEDDPIVTERIEEARKAVLCDEMLRDAKLSAQGRKEAKQARDKLQALIQEDNGLDQPDYVLVSPLTRTLETCDIIFPDNDNIHVRDEIAERRTGKPPDTRSSVHRLTLRPSFQRFSMEQLQDGARNPKFTRRSSSGIDDNKPSIQQQHKIARSISQPEIFLMSDELFRNELDDSFSEEDKVELRKRTEDLFALLCASNSFSVAVVTHKGYLRELERGPFGQPEAPLFDNCEVRVYRITMRNQKLVKAERVPV